MKGKFIDKQHIFWVLKWTGFPVEHKYTGYSYITTYSTIKMFFSYEKAMKYALKNKADLVKELIYTKAGRLIINEWTFNWSQNWLKNYYEYRKEIRKKNRKLNGRA